MIAKGLDGDFATRINRDFDDPVIARLTGRRNALYERIETVLALLGEHLAKMAAGDLR